MEELKAKFDQLLGNGDFKGALEVLGQAAPTYSNEIILTQARLSGLQQNIRLGIISHSDAQINKNQIMAAIMSIGEEVFRGVQNGNGNKPRQVPEFPITPPPEPNSTDIPIYFSYSWKDTSRENEVINRLYDSLKADGYNILRDRDSLGYGEVISTFMKGLGASDLIIIFLSDKYLKSAFCMYEFLEITRNSRNDMDSFKERVLLIPIERINFNSDKILGEYLDYWQKHTQDLKEFIISRIDLVDSERFRNYEISQNVLRNFTAWSGRINDINAPDLELLSENNFQSIKEVIDRRLAALR